jgi:argininosuccinate lyase
MNPDQEKFPAPVYAETVLHHNFADAQKYFLEPLMAIHYAHCLMLARQQIITPDDAQQILGALDRLDRTAILQAQYDGTVEDLFFYVERLLSEMLGEQVAGKLHIARSRNDIDITMYRLRLREELLQLVGETDALRAALMALAQKHLHTVMPAHTHTQPAQPTTLAHYLSAAIEFLARDIARLRAAFATVNCNPLGACAITTTGFAIDRELTAKLLGFEGLVENSYGAIGGIDYLSESLSAMATSMLSLGKFVQDLLLWAMQEFSYIRLSNAYVQTSSIMPQKRNPVALEHARIITSKAFSQAMAVLTSMHNTPFGDIVDVEDDLQPLVFNAFADAHRALKLLTGAVSSITVDEAGLRQKAAGSFLTMTELADTLTREEGLSFKTAHRLVSATVRQLSSAPTDHAAIIETLCRLAPEIIGRKLTASREKLRASLDPLHFVRVRSVIGGPAPERVAEFLSGQERLVQKDRQWLAEKKESIASLPAIINSWRTDTGKPTT